MKTTTNKIQIHVAPGAPQFDVSDFPKETGRESAMYFRQGTVMNVTEAELAHVRESRPDMVKYLTVKTVAKLTKQQLDIRMGAKARAEKKAEAEEAEKKKAKAPSEAQLPAEPAPSSPSNASGNQKSKRNR